MKILPRWVHGVLDYVVSVFLLLAPTLLGFRIGGAAQWLPVALGAVGIFYSLLTRYELGAVPLLSLRTHLVLDTLHGVLLALSPWVFGFADRVWVPHLTLGVLELMVVLLSRGEAHADTRPPIRF